MARQPIVTRIELIEYTFQVDHLGVVARGSNLNYHTGHVGDLNKSRLRIESDGGVRGGMGRRLSGDGRPGVVRAGNCSAATLQWLN